MKPRLRFPKSQIIKYAHQYQASLRELSVEERACTVKERGCLTKSDLRLIALWKAPRSAKHIEKNSENYIQEVTSIALDAKVERTRIESLTILDGVQWPTASAILCQFHKEQYPIMEYRTLWAASLPIHSSYSYEFWWSFVNFTRDISKKLNVDIKTLNKALWQYTSNNH